MGRIVSVVNQKGGVGKTTTTINLACGLAKMSRRVLIVDIDPQGNATSGLGVDKHGVEATLFDVLTGIFSLPSIIHPTSHPSVWVAPSNSDLVGAELELFSKVGRENTLKEHLSKIKDKFDVILIDCPPSLGLLTLNALVASDSILVPLQCEYYSLEGISSLMQTIEVAKENLNPDLSVVGIVLTMVDSRTNLCRQVEQDARKFFGDLVFETTIPRNIRLSEAPSFGLPISLYDAESAGARAYNDLASEVGKRLSMPTLEELEIEATEISNPAKTITELNKSRKKIEQTADNS